MYAGITVVAAAASQDGARRFGATIVKRDGVVRPLVVRFGAMGDMVIVLGLIEALHRRFGIRWTSLPRRMDETAP